MPPTDLRTRAFPQGVPQSRGRYAQLGEGPGQRTVLCAGQFNGNHLPDNPPRWLHMDIAGTAWDADNRGTGYGVGILLAIGAG